MREPEPSLAGVPVAHNGGRRVGRVLEDDGGHCVYVRWENGTAQDGGTDGWYSRHILSPIEPAASD